MCSYCAEKLPAIGARAPSWLSGPVHELLVTRKIPLPSYNPGNGNRPIFAWSEWAQNLLHPDLWAGHYTPLRGLIAECSERRLDALARDVHESCMELTKKALTRLFIFEAVAHFPSSHPFDIREKGMKSRLRTAVSMQVKRDASRLTLIRIFDLSECLHALHERLSFGSPNFVRSSEAFQIEKQICSRIADISSASERLSVQLLENLLNSIRSTLGAYPEHLQWDFHLPQALVARQLSNLLPPIFDLSTDVCPVLSGVNGFEQLFIEQKIESWLFALVTQANFPALDCVVLELMEQIRRGQDVGNISSHIHIDTVVRETAKSLMLSRMASLTTAKVVRENEMLYLSDIHGCQNEESMTLARVLHLILSVSNVQAFLCESQRVTNAYIENGSTGTCRRMLDLLLVLTAEALGSVHSLARKLAEFTQVAQLSKTRYWSFEHTTKMLQTAVQHMACKEQSYKVDVFRQQAVFSAVLQIAKDNLRISAEGCILYRMHYAQNQRPTYYALHLAKIDRTLALTILDIDLQITSTHRKNIENGLHMRCLGIEGYRALRVSAAINDQYSDMGYEEFLDLLTLCHNGILHHEELREATGGELSDVRCASDGGNLFAGWVYSGILMSEGKLIEGVQLMTNVASRGEVFATALIESEAKDWPKDGLTALAAKCQQNQWLARKLALCIRSRMYEEQLQLALASHDGQADGGFAFRNTVFFKNAETHGKITAEMHVQGCTEILRSNMGPLCRSRAARRIGQVLLFGTGGLPQDARRAQAYFDLAAILGSPRAYVDIGSLYEREGASGIEPDGRTALAYYLSFLGTHCLNSGCVQDMQAYVFCQSLIANMLLTGARYVPADFQTAELLYRDLFRRIGTDGGRDCYRVILTWYSKTGQPLESTLVVTGNASSEADESIENLLTAIGTGRVDISHAETLCVECNTTLDQRYRSMDSWIFPW